MMETLNLFNSSGEFLAVKRSKYLFDSKSNWIGWLPWDDGEVVNRYGEYVATIFEDRLYTNTRREFKQHPGYADFPGHIGSVDYPDYPGSKSIPTFMIDVDMELLDV